MKAGLARAASGMAVISQDWGDTVLVLRAHEHPGVVSLPGTVGAIGWESVCQADS